MRNRNLLVFLELRLLRYIIARWSRSWVHLVQEVATVVFLWIQAFFALLFPQELALGLGRWLFLVRKLCRLVQGDWGADHTGCFVVDLLLVCFEPGFESALV